MFCGLINGAAELSRPIPHEANVDSTSVLEWLIGKVPILESDDAIAILENVDEKDKNDILSSLPPKDRFALL